MENYIRVDENNWDDVYSHCCLNYEPSPNGFYLKSTRGYFHFTETKIFYHFRYHRLIEDEIRGQVSVFVDNKGVICKKAADLHLWVDCDKQVQFGEDLYCISMSFEGKESQVIAYILPENVGLVYKKIYEWMYEGAGQRSGGGV